MTSTSLVFRLIGVDMVSPATRSAAASMAVAGVAVAGAAAAIAGASIGMADKWEVAMTRVITGAGEAKSAIKGDSDALLDMMGRVGLSAEDLSMAFYNVNSAGYHAAAGLHVTEIAAMGARVGVADLYATTDGLTTILNAYRMGSEGAARAMNVLIGTEVHGKATLEELAKAFPTVATAAATANISLEELGGALAAMTSAGLKADVAATYLRQTITQLSAPTPKAIRSMESLGLKATDVSKTLGSKGLGAAIDMLSNAIEKKMGPSGLVAMNTLKKTADNATEFEKALANMDPKMRTYIGAMADMVGGTKSMQGALMLGGQYADKFAEFTKSITVRATEAGQSVEGWTEAQQTLTFKMDALKGTIRSIVIIIGTELLPAAKDTADKLLELARAVKENRDEIVVWGARIAEAGKILVVAALASKISKITAAVAALRTTLATTAIAAGGPWGILAAIIAAAIYVIWTKTEWLQAAWKSAWPKMTKVYNDAKAALQDSGAIDSAKGKWSSFISMVKGAAADIKAASDALAAAEPGDRGKMVKGGAKSAASGAVAMAGKGAKVAADKVIDLVAFGQDLLGQLPGVISRAAPKLAPLVGRALTSMLHLAGKLAGRGLGRLIDFAEALPGMLRNLVAHGPAKFKGALSGLIAKVGPMALNAMANLGQSIIGGLLGVLGSLPGLAKNALMGIVYVIGWLIGAVLRGLHALPGLLKKWYLLLGTVVLEGAKKAWDYFIFALTELPEKILKFLPKLIDAIWDFFAKTDWGKVGSSIVDGIVNAVKWVGNKITQLAKDLADSFLGGFKDALGIKSPSKKMYEAGHWGVLGVVNSLSDGKSLVRTAGGGLADAMHSGFDAKNRRFSIRGYGSGDGAVPAGYQRASSQSEVEFKGERQVVSFVKALVKTNGGGSVQRAFGSA